MSDTTAPAMNPVVKAAWLTALRSGDYDQTTEYLNRVSGGFCCLGVLCDLAERANIVTSSVVDYGVETVQYRGVELTEDTTEDPKEGEDGYSFNGDPLSELRSYTTLPISVQKWAGLTGHDPYVTDTNRLMAHPEEGYSGDATISLSSLNDSGQTFAQIADEIERSL